MPNVLITGTPGTGKTSLAKRVAESLGMTHVDVSSLVQQREFHDGFDEEFQSWFLNEDKLLDYMEDELHIRSQRKPGFVVDYHGSEFFPQAWFDLVVVLRCENSVLYERLSRRGYSQKKIEENVSAEIMQVLLDEAMESYNPDIVLELQSSTPEDSDNNFQTISQWIQSSA